MGTQARAVNGTYALGAYKTITIQMLNRVGASKGTGLPYASPEGIRELRRDLREVGLSPLGA